MKRAAIDHPKMRRLRVHLKVPIYGAIGIMESLWHFAAKFAPAGDIGRWMDEEIADAVGWPIEDAANLVRSLVASGWVDDHDGCRLIVHDWPDHCEDQVHSTLARQRLRFANGAAPRLRQLSQSERVEAEKAYVANPASADCGKPQGAAPAGRGKPQGAGAGDCGKPQGRTPALPCHAMPSQAIATPTPPDARAQPPCGELAAIPPEFDPRADEAWQAVTAAIEKSGMAKPSLSHPRRLKLLAALDQGLKPGELAEAIGWWASSPESPRMRGMGMTIDTPLSDPVKYLDMARAPPPKSKAEAAKDALDSLVFEDKPEVRPRVRR